MTPTGTRNIELTAEAEKALVSDYRFSWYQSEALVKRVSAKYQGQAIDPQEPGRIVEWLMTSQHDPSIVYFAQIAQVVNGKWYFSFSPDETAFSPGNYRGYLRTYRVEDDEVVDSLMLAREEIVVLASPGWENVPVIGPITGPFVRLPSEWPAGYLLASTDGGETTVAVPPGEGGGGGGLDTDDFEDSDSVTWEVVEGKLRANVDLPEATGTMLQKEGIDLTGTYKLGTNLSVDGDTIDADVDTSGLLEVGGTPAVGKAPVYAAAPYNQALWRHVANLASLPATGEPQCIWWHPENQEFYLAQPYAYSQSPSDPGDVQIGDGVAIFSDIGEHAFVVPPGVTMLQVKGWGQAGGNGNTASRGGLGGHVQGYLLVTPGETINLITPGHTPSMSYLVGGIGGGGLALGSCGGGGGAAVMWRGSESFPNIALSNLLAVAGGGGGAGVANFGGGGGGLVGGNGVLGPTGGTQSIGGSDYGSYLQGGNKPQSGGGAAGGGGGYYGGGTWNIGANAAGGGGSSYIGGLLFAFTFTGPFSQDSD